MEKEEKKFMFYEKKIVRFLNHSIKKEIRKLKEKVMKERLEGGK